MCEASTNVPDRKLSLLRVPFLPCGAISKRTICLREYHWAHIAASAALQRPTLMVTSVIDSTSRWCRRLGSLLFLALGISLQAQNPPSGSAGSVPTFQSKVDVVLVDVVVTDSKDEPVTGLDKKDFEISEDGKP